MLISEELVPIWFFKGQSTVSSALMKRMQVPSTTTTRPTEVPATELAATIAAATTVLAEADAISWRASVGSESAGRPGAWSSSLGLGIHLP